MARPIEFRSTQTMLTGKTERFVVFTVTMPSTDYTVTCEFEDSVYAWWVTDKQLDRCKVHIWQSQGSDIDFQIHVYHDARTFEYSPP